MSERIIFVKSYDDDMGFYRYFCDGTVVYSSEDLSEDYVRSNLEVL